MAFPAIRTSAAVGEAELANALWENRVLDVWVQIALIFSGVMGVLGWLSEKVPGAKEEVDL